MPEKLDPKPLLDAIKEAFAWASAVLGVPVGWVLIGAIALFAAYEFTKLLKGKD